MTSLFSLKITFSLLEYIIAVETYINLWTFSIAYCKFLMYYVLFKCKMSLDLALSKKNNLKLFYAKPFLSITFYYLYFVAGWSSPLICLPSPPPSCAISQIIQMENIHKMCIKWQILDCYEIETFFSYSNYI